MDLWRFGLNVLVIAAACVLVYVSRSVHREWRKLQAELQPATPQLAGRGGGNAAAMDWAGERMARERAELAGRAWRWSAFWKVFGACAFGAACLLAGLAVGRWIV